jgi:hypothetical protein
VNTDCKALIAIGILGYMFSSFVLFQVVFSLQKNYLKNNHRQKI